MKNKTQLRGADNQKRQGVISFDICRAEYERELNMSPQEKTKEHSKRKARRTANKIAFCLTSALGVAGLALWAFFVAWDIFGRGMPLYVLIPVGIGGMAVCLYVAVVLHELGHLAFGSIGGMKFKSIYFPFLSVREVNGKMSAKMEKRLSYLGANEMYPSADAHPYKAFLWMVAGGPVGSLLTLAASIVILALAPYINDYLVVLFGIPAPLLFWHFWENAYPYSVNGMNTDGMQFYSAVSGKPESEIIVNTMLIQKHYVQGYSPAEVPVEYPEGFPVRAVEDPNYAVILNNRYLKALDDGSVSEIRRENARIRAEIPFLADVFAEQMIPDIFFDSLFVCQDHDFVTMHRQAVFNRLNEDDSVCSCRIRGYYYLYCGDFDCALEEVAKGRSLADSYSLKGIAKMELKLLDQLEELALKNK